VQVLKKEIGAFTDMAKWNFIEGSSKDIKAVYRSFNVEDSLSSNLSSFKSFLIDKNGNLRGRTKDEKLFGYDMESVSELNAKLKDDVKVLYYEYYAAFKDKNKNKADRKEVGL
jgi:hypothetical protein